MIEVLRQMTFSIMAGGVIYGLKDDTFVSRFGQASISWIKT